MKEFNFAIKVVGGGRTLVEKLVIGNLYKQFYKEQVIRPAFSLDKF